MSDDQLRWLIIGISVLLIIIVLVIVFKLKTKKKGVSEFPELLEALGGVDNISNILLNGSRISLNFENKKNVNKDQIKENGVETIVVSNKKLTMVIGKKASIIHKYLAESVKKHS